MTHMIFSDRGIKQAMEKGHLRIEPFDASRLGPMSYDLAVGTLYERRWDREVIDGMPYEEFLAECCKPLAGIDLEPEKPYFGTSKETIIKTSGIPEIAVTTRSSLARDGVEVEADRQELRSRNGKVPLCVRTHNTRVMVPWSYPMAQLVFETGLPLDEVEIADTLSSDVRISGNPKIIRENQMFPGVSFGYMRSGASLLLHLGNGLKRYKGDVMDISKNSSAHFEEIDISKGYWLQPGEFYLGFTEEEVSFSTRYAGKLMRLFLDIGNAVHMNAPWIHPGSKGNQVLEMSVASPKRVVVGMPVCRMEIHRLDQEPEKSYASVGRYVGQNGPATSRSHLDFHH